VPFSCGIEASSAGGVVRRWAGGISMSMESVRRTAETAQARVTERAYRSGANPPESGCTT
jgi:hypothetical protein